MNAVLWATLLGGLAIPLSILKFQTLRHNRVLGINVLTGILVGSQFLVLGQPMGASMAYVSAGSGLFALLVGRKLALKWKFTWVLGVGTLMLLLHPLTVQTWWQALPILAALTGRMAELQSDQRIMRLVFLPAHFFWMVYAILTLAWASVVLEILQTGSNLIGIRRLRLADKVCSS